MRDPRKILGRFEREHPISSMVTGLFSFGLCLALLRAVQLNKPAIASYLGTFPPSTAQWAVFAGTVLIFCVGAIGIRLFLYGLAWQVSGR